MSTADAITNGVGAHGMWKQRILTAIETGKSDWTPAIVTQDNQCEFGKWLYSCSPEEKSSSHYGTVKELHAKFHKTAANVLSLALSGKKAEASTAIDAGSEYHSISTNLTLEMMSWRKDEACMKV